jgi:hypothetical protein
MRNVASRTVFRTRSVGSEKAQGCCLERASRNGQNPRSRALAQHVLAGDTAIARRVLASGCLRVILGSPASRRLLRGWALPVRRQRATR